MIRNYLLTAFRSFFKYKGYSFINIMGLAIGLACTFLILLWVQDELSYDKFHENYENIYRLCNKQTNTGFDFRSVATQVPLPGYLKENFPEIENFTTCRPGSDRFLMKYGEKVFGYSVEL